jgi:hypothetical protein
MATAGLKSPTGTSRVIEMGTSPIDVARERSAEAGQQAYLTALKIQTGIETVKFTNSQLQIPDSVREALSQAATYKSLHSIQRYPAIARARDVLTAGKQKIQKRCKLEPCGGNLWILWEEYLEQYLEMYFDWEKEADELREELIAGLATGYENYREEVLSILRSTGMPEAEVQGNWLLQYDSFYQKEQFDEGFYVSLVNPKPILPDPSSSPLVKRAAETELKTIQKETAFSFEREVGKLQAELEEFLSGGSKPADKVLQKRLERFKDLSDRITTCKVVLGLQVQELENALTAMKHQVQEALDGSQEEKPAVEPTKTKRRPKAPKIEVDEVESTANDEPQDDSEVEQTEASASETATPAADPEDSIDF